MAGGHKYTTYVGSTQWGSVQSLFGFVTAVTVGKMRNSVRDLSPLEPPEIQEAGK